MRVKEVAFGGFRGFQATRRVSFVDPVLGTVRPLTVLAGSNGSGKTTMFEAIYELLASAAEPWGVAPLVDELQQRGFLFGTFHFDAPELQGDCPIFAGSGAPEDVEATMARSQVDPANRARSLRERVMEMAAGRQPLQDGVLLFPHNRWVEHRQAGAIMPPAVEPTWLWRFKPAEAWQGSLAQLWVWQNYLDLEAGAADRKNLVPFVELVETVLGEGRKVRIRQGRVEISRNGQGLAVEPHQLPSGEQQVLTLFGELARRLRPGAIVLIDEVEISLHPALQRKVIAALRALAARYDLQVIVSTHSTEILRAVDPGEVVSLDDLDVVAS